MSSSEATRPNRYSSPSGENKVQRPTTRHFKRAGIWLVLATLWLNAVPILAIFLAYPLGLTPAIALDARLIANIVLVPAALALHVFAIRRAVSSATPVLFQQFAKRSASFFNTLSASYAVLVCLLVALDFSLSGESELLKETLTAANTIYFSSALFLVATYVAHSTLRRLGIGLSAWILLSGMGSFYSALAAFTYVGALVLAVPVLFVLVSHTGGPHETPTTTG